VSHLLALFLFVQPAILVRTPSAATIDPNRRYAVLLNSNWNNNAVYFGKRQGRSQFPVLTEAYYMQSDVKTGNQGGRQRPRQTRNGMARHPPHGHQRKIGSGSI
jgi:hypothetical protein